MERYEICDEVGYGTYGTVFKARNRESNEMVAVKRLKKKYETWEECINLPEVKSLRTLHHPNIVKLIEVIKENDQLFLVFEHMDFSLCDLIENRGKPFSESQIRKWCFQILTALSYLHGRGYIHRDMKPANLLLAKGVVKIADFGFARIMSNVPYTEYFGTLYYQAPENLLGSSVYGPAIDMWAMGAIIAELFTLTPLFCGYNEIDQIYKICEVIGSPDVELQGLEFGINYEFPKSSHTPLSSLIPSASPEAIDLISSLCNWDPLKRPTAEMALRHSFFRPIHCVSPSLYPAPPSKEALLEPRHSTRMICEGTNRSYSNEVSVRPQPYNMQRPVKASSIRDSSIHQTDSWKNMINRLVLDECC